MAGQINWVEIPAADTAKARIFYGGLFGWTTNAFGDDYHVIDGGPAGAIPGVGRIAHCQDDQGIPFSLYEPERQS
ncbi:hypothetical protein [Amycolatopsis sp. NPDC049868]|uniref:hypothetical protein n=1 Tax=Amycolatopsis sp. NPDC049868 TaxID=3363934 RepID=UPI0037987FA7